MRRSGFTLIESVGVIVAIGMLMTLSISLLNLSYRTHRSMLSHLQRMHSLEQFVQRWREDVHSAKEVTQGEELSLVQDDDVKVVYIFHDQQVTRVRRRAEEELGTDGWQLPSPCTANWRLDSEGRWPLLEGTLTFDQTPVAIAAITMAARVGSGESR